MFQEEIAKIKVELEKINRKTIEKQKDTQFSEFISYLVGRRTILSREINGAMTGVDMDYKKEQLRNIKIAEAVTNYFLKIKNEG